MDILSGLDIIRTVIKKTETGSQKSKVKSQNNVMIFLLLIFDFPFLFLQYPSLLLSSPEDCSIGLVENFLPRTKL